MVWCSIFHRGQENGISEYRFREHIIPLCIRLAEAISEIQWSARLNPMNHPRLWPTVVTAAVDTFPIEVIRTIDISDMHAPCYEIYHPLYAS